MSSIRTMSVLLRQQLGARVPSLIVWVVVWSLLLLLFAVVFNSLSKDAAESAKVFQQLPNGVYSSFNIDPSSYLSKIESFISGQFLSVYMLAGSIFAFSFGVGAIGKKIESRTVAMLLTKPLARGQLYMVQALVAVVFFIVVSSALCGMSLLIFNSLLQTQSHISTSYFVSLYCGSCLLFASFTLLGQLVGTVLNGGRAITVGAGIVVVSWFLNSLAPLAHLPAFVQYLSPFHYFDVSLLRSSYVLAGALTLQLAGIMIGFLLIGWYVFKQKDIYV